MDATPSERPPLSAWPRQFLSRIELDRAVLYARPIAQPQVSFGHDPIANSHVLASDHTPADFCAIVDLN